MNSKQIGNNYEREIAKKLSIWVSNNERDDVIWRDLSSGARATTRKKQDKDSIQMGDFVATCLQYEWVTQNMYIDSKCYQTFNPLFINKKNIKSNGIYQQWVKVKNDCPIDKIPIMICKIRDRITPEFVILPEFCNIYFTLFSYITYSFEDKHENCILILLDDFFKIDAKLLKK